MSDSDSSPSAPSPVWLATLCYVIWGFVPLSYLPMKAFGADALEIIIHRSVWAAVWAGGLVWFMKQMPQVRSYLATPSVRYTLMLSSLMIGLNWAVYVWAVTHAHVIEAALGYYLNPLLNMAAGAILFRERLDIYGKAAIGLAVIGVGFQAWALGSVPYVALILALSFGLYGILRKTLAVSAMGGLFIECLFMLPLGLIGFTWFETTGNGHFLSAPGNTFWFLLTGPITVLPLFLFAYVARRLRLSTMGFIQFVSPTIAFCIGLMLGEPFTALRGVSFVFIWAGAAVFAFGAWRKLRAVKINPSV